MKLLLTYVNPSGFDEESKRLVKLQIDNSLELGWKKEDIVLITNFPYEYGGIKATLVNKGYCEFEKEGSKVFTIVHLFDLGFFEDNLLYWFHDLDAYQLEPITEAELELDGFDLGICDYTRARRWQFGSFFFKKTAEDIFRLTAQQMSPKYACPDEEALLFLTDNNINGITSRIKKLNGTYNFGMRRVDFCYERANKPLKVIHFHPYHPRNNGLNTLAIAMYGRNRIGKPLMTERLKRLFNKYGYA